MDASRCTIGADCYTRRYAGAVAHDDAQKHRNRDGDANPDRNRDGNPDADVLSDGNGDLHCHSDPYADTDCHSCACDRNATAQLYTTAAIGDPDRCASRNVHRRTAACATHRTPPVEPTAPPPPVVPTATDIPPAPPPGPTALPTLPR